MSRSTTLISVGALFMLAGGSELLSVLTGASQVPFDAVTVALIAGMLGVGFGLCKQWRIAAQILWAVTIILPVGVLVRDWMGGEDLAPVLVRAILLFTVMAFFSFLVWLRRKHLVSAREQLA